MDGKFAKTGVYTPSTIKNLDRICIIQYVLYLCVMQVYVWVYVYVYVLCPGFKNPSLPLKVPGYTLLFHSRPSVFWKWFKTIDKTYMLSDECMKLYSLKKIFKNNFFELWLNLIKSFNGSISNYIGSWDLILQNL